MRHCESPTKTAGNQCPIAMSPSVASAFRCANLLDQHLITMQDMDAWYFEAAEFVQAERSRLRNLAMKERAAGGN